MPTGRIPLRFGRLRPLFTVLGTTRGAHIDIADDTVEVRMSYAFRASIPRSSIRSATLEPRAITWSIGVHGWRGRCSIIDGLRLDHLGAGWLAFRF